MFFMILKTRSPLQFSNFFFSLVVNEANMRCRGTKKLTFSVVPVMTWSPSYVDFMYIP